MVFGLLSYSGTDNVGDEIQSLAALGLIPDPKYYFNRDNLGQAGDDIDPADPHVSVIMNGWFGQYPENWPPADKIRPLLVSMHITQEEVSSKFNIKPDEFMLAPSLVKYMQHHGPAGARDRATLKLLQKAGIDSYFSGCLTLTLNRPDVKRADDLIVFCDVAKEAVTYARAQARRPVLTVSHTGYGESNVAERFERAKELLSLYARASCVVTSRLHCALPCLAMGTPVLFINIVADPYRLDGLLDFLHHGTADEFTAGLLDYDINDPPPNKTKHLFYRKNLINQVKSFVQDDQEFRWRPNPSHPTEEDKKEALQYIQYCRSPSLEYQSTQNTYIKRKAIPSSELDEGSKIPVQVNSRIIGKKSNEDNQHSFLEGVTLNGAEIEGGPWCIYHGHWETVHA